MTHFEDAVRLRQAELLPKRDLVEKCLREQLPEWNFMQPRGGPCIWVKLPLGDGAAFAQLALRRRVVIAYGNMFSAAGSCSEYVRIPFLLDAESLQLGMEHLREAWHEMSTTNVDFRQAPAMLI